MYTDAKSHFCVVIFLKIRYLYLLCNLKNKSKNNIIKTFYFKINIAKNNLVI